MSVEQGSTLFFCICTRVLRSPRLTKNLRFMSNKNSNEELQSRREFFKKAAKAALPVIGIIAISNVPLVDVCATQSSATGCLFGCSGSCSGDCSGTCKDTCRGACQSGCSGFCLGNCKGTCTAACANNCGNACATNCVGNCKSSCYGCKGTCSNTCKGDCSGSSNVYSW